MTGMNETGEGIDLTRAFETKYFVTYPYLEWLKENFCPTIYYDFDLVRDPKTNLIITAFPQPRFTIKDENNLINRRVVDRVCLDLVKILSVKHTPKRTEDGHIILTGGSRFKVRKNFSTKALLIEDDVAEMHGTLWFERVFGFNPRDCYEGKKISIHSLDSLVGFSGTEYTEDGSLIYYTEEYASAIEAWIRDQNEESRDRMDKLMAEVAPTMDGLDSRTRLARDFIGVYRHFIDDLLELDPTSENIINRDDMTDSLFIQAIEERSEFLKGDRR